MRSKDQILAEVLDSLIRPSEGRVPDEIGSLVEIGLRLYNECPEADPAFLKRLGQQLQAEWAPPRPRLNDLFKGLLLRLAPAWPKVSRWALRLGAAVMVALGLTLALSSIPGLRSSQASLSRVIRLFQHVPVEQRPATVSTPWPSPAVWRSFLDVAQAEEATGLAIRTPSYLPASVVLDSVQAGETQGRWRVILHYRPANEVGMALFLQEVQAGGTPEQGVMVLEIGEGSAERVLIAGRPALWVGGHWSADGRWVSSRREGAVLVQDGDVLFILSGTCGRAEMIRVAESLFP
ncbi:MAG TPA: hypothetical protein PLJ35_17615 [Anaerolineae bacterium]|nr:hypothetical protein [Anaerolineae bacterium]HOR00633.1 hypothetical protein [Anaerolineae bacterium]HPL30970.1 hypothetical protein [Anaerolineae bacterium]